MHRILIAGLLVTGLLAATGCAESTSSPDSAAKPAPANSTADSRTIRPLGKQPAPKVPVTVASADGKQVTVTDVSRIVPLTGGLAEIVFTLGLGGNVVGRDIATTFDAAKHLPVVTHAHDVAVEGVLKLRPTVVLVETGTGPPEAITQLRAAGVPILVFTPATSLEQVQPRIKAVAAGLGVPSSGTELADRTDDEIAVASRRVPAGDQPTVAFLYLRGTAGVYLLGGEGSGADSMIEAAGAVDAGSRLKRGAFTPLTSEALVAAAPDVLLVMTGGLASVGGIDGLVKLPGVAQTPAAKNRRVVAVEDGVLLNFGPRTAQVIDTLVSQFHPGAK